jgi:ABC-2 type transport system permease protein
MTSSLWRLTSLQFKEYLRDPEVLVWSLIFPIALAGILGLAFSGSGQAPRPVGLVRTHTAADAPLLDWRDRITAAAAQAPAPDRVPARFAFREFASAEAALLALKRGQLALFADAPAGAGVRFHFDPAHSEAQQDYLLLQQYARSDPGTGAIAPLRSVGSRYIDFLIPGLIALGIMNSCLWGVGWALIERRMKKLLRRMVATPMRRHELLISYLFTRLVLNGLEAVLLFGFSAWLFGVRVQGSWAALVLMYLAGNLAFGGIAVWMGSRTANTQVGNGLLNAITVPMTVVSGIFFSYYHFPSWLVGIVQLLPLTLLADGLRRVVLEPVGLGPMLLPAAVLSALGAACFALGLRWFKWY